MLIRTSGKIIPIDGKIYWHIENFTPDMDKFKTIFIFEQMFKIWQKDFVPTFESTSDINESQITLRFRNTGDADLPEPFGDGTLAYAYLANDTTAAGVVSDVFFNDFYKWGEMHKDAHISLLKVAVHEVGHALGLHHSDDPIDIMYWQYQSDNNLIITLDTLAGIYKLYGNPHDVPEGMRYADVYGEIFNSKRDLLRIPESDLVIMAANLGIGATSKDLKSETVDKILEVLP